MPFTLAEYVDTARLSLLNGLVLFFYGIQILAFYGVDFSIPVQIYPLLLLILKRPGVYVENDISHHTSMSSPVLPSRIYMEYGICISIEKRVISQSPRLCALTANSLAAFRSSS